MKSLFNGNIKLKRLSDEEKNYELLAKWYQDVEVYKNFEQRKLSLSDIKNKYYPRTSSDSKVIVYFIYYDDIPVGIIQYKLVSLEDQILYNIRDNNVYEIDIFIGDSSMRHKGIGSKVIDILSSYLFYNNASYLIMCPLKTNIKAINCYKKCNFIINGYFDTEDTIGVLNTYYLMIRKK